MIQQFVIQNYIYLLTFSHKTEANLRLTVCCTSLWTSEGKRNSETSIWGKYLQVSEAAGRDNVDTWSEPGCLLVLYRLHVHVHACLARTWLFERVFTNTDVDSLISGPCVWGRMLSDIIEMFSQSRSCSRHLSCGCPQICAARPRDRPFIQVARPPFLLHDCVTAATATAFRSRCYVFYPDKSLRTFDIYRENAIHPGLAGESGLFSHKGCFWAI